VQEHSFRKDFCSTKFLLYTLTPCLIFLCLTAFLRNQPIFDNRAQPLFPKWLNFEQTVVEQNTRTSVFLRCTYHCMFHPSRFFVCSKLFLFCSHLSKTNTSQRFSLQRPFFLCPASMPFSH
jgi:hypothetical protein